MVLTNRKGDMLAPVRPSGVIKHHPFIVHRPVPGILKHAAGKIRKHTPKPKSVYPFRVGIPSIPRPAPVAVTQAMQLNSTGATKAQVLPSNPKPQGMSKKVKGAIAGGVVGGAFGAAWAAGIAKDYFDTKAFNKTNQDFATKAENDYQMVRNQGFPNKNIKEGLKDYFSAKPEQEFMKDAEDVGFQGATKNALQNIAHPSPANEVDEWFDTVEDIAHIAE